MAKWYVEYKIHKNGHSEYECVNGINARDGKEAIEYVKEHIAIGAYNFKAYHDDDDNNEEENS